jgi:hypothetical protein
MSILKRREPTIDELLSGQVMQTMLQHARKTPDDMRAMLRDVATRRSPAELRATARNLLRQSRAYDDPQPRRQLAKQARLLTQRAKRLEREQEAAKR